MFTVFDCTKATGEAVRLPFAPLARLAAHALTLATGRFHDFDSVTRFHAPAPDVGNYAPPAPRQPWPRLPSPVAGVSLPHLAGLALAACALILLPLAL